MSRKEKRQQTEEKRKALAKEILDTIIHKIKERMDQGDAIAQAMDYAGAAGDDLVQSRIKRTPQDKQFIMSAAADAMNEFQSKLDRAAQLSKGVT